MKMAVTLSNVSVAFFDTTVLQNISAVFPSNRISVLLGRSGSGKTTLLRTINRLNEEFPGCVTTGKVTVDFGYGAHDIYAKQKTGSSLALSQLRLKAGMLFQSPNCFPVSVYRNIAMPLSLMTSVPDKELPSRVESALMTVGLWNELKDKLQKPAHILSGGQQQRLCLARLLALEPAVLLLDEPTASLDVHSARASEALLSDLATRYTIIMVSHGLRQARRMADKVFICDQGAITYTFDDKKDVTEDALAELLSDSDI